MKRVAIALIMLSGCSWMLSRGPERGRPCTANHVPPALDTVEAIGGAVIALLALGYVQEGHNDGDLVGMIGLSAAGVGLVYAASAKYGYDRAAECRAMR